MLLRHKISETHTWGVFDAEGLGCRFCPRNNLEGKQGKPFPFNASERSDQTKYVSLDCMGLEGYRESDDRGGALPMCWGGGISCLDQDQREVGHGAARRRQSTKQHLQTADGADGPEADADADQPRMAVIGLSDSMASRLGASSRLEALPAAGGRFRQIGTGPKLNAETDRTRVVGVARVGG